MALPLLAVAGISAGVGGIKSLLQSAAQNRQRKALEEQIKKTPKMAVPAAYTENLRRAEEEAMAAGNLPRSYGIGRSIIEQNVAQGIKTAKETSQTGTQASERALQALSQGQGASLNLAFQSASEQERRQQAALQNLYGAGTQLAQAEGEQFQQNVALPAQMRYQLDAQLPKRNLAIDAAGGLLQSGMDVGTLYMMSQLFSGGGFFSGGNTTPQQ